MMNDLSLKGQKVFLINIEDKNNLQDSAAILEKREQQKHMELLIMLKSCNKKLGRIYSYNYNKIDGYIYINLIFNEEEDEEIILEACDMFTNYLFTCFPIRKVYYETCDYLLEKINIKVLKKLKFKLEADLKEDSFFNGKYYSRYILALYREEFEEHKDGK